jgi:hypothetical protein
MTGLRVTTGGGATAATERFSAGVSAAIYRSVLQGALLLGRKIAEHVEDFKETAGTRRLSRSFLVPVPGPGNSFILGADSPVYAAIHEFGGTIEPRHAEYLVFQTPDGEWHSVKQVHIREKRYARDAIEEFERDAVLPSILAANLTAEFKV